ncbi:HECT E3 ubiquitin ligase [Achlya hypogyna]|uniref:HECT-type E3 ubiquitin transferase n=1 Tax=Achlya hypogyna TaxID=1202772 RepID=A0A1V9ZJ00_ACHHY|nr:HECT E3 ubiquitin ligase [Achlya hypogyna]
MSDNEDETMSEHELLRTLRALSQQTNDLPQALRGLLGQLGTDLPIFGLNPQYRDILERIRPGSPPQVQTASLADLCELLSMTSEEMLTIAGFDVQGYIPVLASLIQTPATIDVLLHASRALAGLLDIFSSPAVLDLALSHGLVASLCEKLLNIEYMDVAEVALRMLERIANSPVDGVRVAVLSENALVALLQFVDFFSTDVQRGAARTAALLCTTVPVEAWTHVEAALPLLASLTKSHDAQIVASGCVAFQRLCDSQSVKAAPGLLDELFADGLLAHLLQLLGTYTAARRPDTMAPATYATLMHLLASALQLREVQALVASAEVGAVLPAVLVGPASPALLDAALRFVGAMLRPKASPLYAAAVNTLVDTLVPCMFAAYDSSRNSKYLGKLHELVTFLSARVLTHTRVLSKFVAVSVGRCDAAELALALAIVALAMEHAPETYRAGFVRDGVVEALAALPDAATLVQQHFAGAPTESPLVTALREVAVAVSVDAGAWTRLDSLLSVETPTVFELRSSGLVPALTAAVPAPASFAGWPALVGVVRDAVGAEMHAVVSGARSVVTGPIAALPMVELLGQHLKMRLQMAAAKQLDSVVLVEPLARIETLEEFVADKVLGPADTPNDGPRVVAVLADRAVPSDFTVLEALVRCVPRDAPLDVTALWQATQTLVFFPRGPEAPAVALHDEPEAAQSALWEHLELLRCVQGLPGVDTTLPVVAAHVDQCLAQPLLVALRLLPAWCRHLVRDFAFVLPRDTKLHVLYGTRFGPARALQYLGRTLWKQPADTALATAVARVAKLPRLKVRVARAKLLASAQKLLSAYGGAKAIVEIEYLGEVGTGLGPTTEFFSLVSREVQAQQLGLWRDDGPPPLPAAPAANPAVVAPAMAVRGYHRFAVVHCAACGLVAFPSCDTCGTLATGDDGCCAGCGAAATVVCATTGCTQAVLAWWVVSNNELAYLARAYPRQQAAVRHPVLQCSHCLTVSFPGTDAGLVVLDGDRMVSRSGRRMYERDYRAVTKHVSALCEGTPLQQLHIRLERDAVDTLVHRGSTSPEVLDSHVDGIDASLGADVSVVAAPHGLYPAPIGHRPAGEQTRVLGWFAFLGKLVAQALLDERLLDLPLALPFVRALRGEDLVHDEAAALAHATAVDPAIGRSLGRLWAQPDDPAIDDMGLSFVLLGDDTVEICEGGAAKGVTRVNVRDFVRQSLRMLLDTSIAAQVRAFREGFGSLVPEDVLDYLSAPEWLQLIADPTTELWPGGAEEIAAHMVCDHGYSSDSRAIRWLIQILCELSPAEQRLFVRFVTGSHRLPLGGLAKLSPSLTVVRKLSPDDGHGNDDILPSASTCTNYLKLPDYSSLDIMRTKLCYCIQEGQLSFHLS